MFAFLSGLFGALFSNSVAWFVGLKALLTVLMMTVLPIVLNNFFDSIIEGMVTLAGEALGSPSGVTVQFTGLAGFLGDKLKVTEAFSIIVSACITKFSWRLIPFLRL